MMVKFAVAAFSLDVTVGNSGLAMVKSGEYAVTLPPSFLVPQKLGGLGDIESDLDVVNTNTKIQNSIKGANIESTNVAEL